MAIALESWTSRDADARQGADAGPADEATMAGVILNWVRERPAAAIMREKRLGLWRDISWGQFCAVVRELGCALLAQGWRPGDVTCVLAGNRAEWVYADVATLFVGGICGGIYPTSAPVQVRDQLAGARCRVLFAENEEQLDKVLEVAGDLPDLARIVLFDALGVDLGRDARIVTLADFLADGRRFDAERPGAWQARAAEIRPDWPALIVFTSGTSGQPKAAVISHRNLMVQAREGVKLTGQVEGDERLSFLPLCHAAERVVGLYYALYAGTVTNFVERLETLVEYAREIEPSFFMAVPRFWQKFHASIAEQVAEASWFQRAAYRAAIGVGAMRAQHRIDGRPVPAWLRIAFAVAYRVALKRIRLRLGLDRCRFLTTGAAPTAPDLIRWYLALGLEMREVYGQTEASGLVTIMPADRIKPGSAGRIAPFLEAKLSRDGELWLRGPTVFAGYLNAPRESAHAIVDGWLRTGDIARFDEDGYLFITGRARDILITAGGKNIAPEAIENLLRESRYIADAVAIGDGRKYLTALIVADQDSVSDYAARRDIGAASFAALCRHPQIHELMRGEVERANARLSRPEAVKKFYLIPDRITVTDQEMTPTMKLKRRLVEKRYAAEIERMYE